MTRGELTGHLCTSAEVGVLLATYCEASNIERLVTEVENLKMKSQILVIDDSSPDGTADIVEALQRRYGNILLLARPSKSGLGTALRDGFKTFLSLKNPPERIIAMDADYSHNPNDIPTLLEGMQEGVGLVIGSRYCSGGKIMGWSIARRMVSRIANILARTMAGLNLSDCTSGFRCYSAEFLRAAAGNLHCTTYEIQIEIARQARLHKFSIKETPVLFINRKRGKSKLSAAEIGGFISYLFKTARNK